MQASYLYADVKGERKISTYFLGFKELMVSSVYVVGCPSFDGSAWCLILECTRHLEIRSAYQMRRCRTVTKRTFITEEPRFFPVRDQILERRAVNTS